MSLLHALCDLELQQCCHRLDTLHGQTNAQDCNTTMWTVCNLSLFELIFSHTDRLSVTGAAEADVLPAHLGGYQQGMTAIACGARHTGAVGSMGQLFCWGWSLHGQCGQGRAVVTVPSPHLVSGNASTSSIGTVLWEQVSVSLYMHGNRFHPTVHCWCLQLWVRLVIKSIML